jgi:hypothetical protein
MMIVNTLLSPYLHDNTYLDPILRHASVRKYLNPI